MGPKGWQVSKDHGIPCIPCGQCVGCRIDRSREWAVRITHEAQMYPEKQNSFLSLTYNDDHIPEGGVLKPDHLQSFMKRLREKVYPHQLRFFAVGEYGDRYTRPHYHVCLFGLEWQDLYKWKKTKRGNTVFRSPTLETVWKKGFSDIGQLNWQSAAYAARYILKKQTGKRISEYPSYVDRSTGEIINVPEFTRSSNRPGLGHDWFMKYWKDVYPHDFVILKDKQFKTPRYYDKLLERYQPEVWQEVLEKRVKEAEKEDPDKTPERLRTRENIKEGQIKRLPREYENETSGL